MKDQYKELMEVLSNNWFTDIEIHAPIIDSNILCKSPTQKTVCITLYPERYRAEELMMIKADALSKYDKWVCLTIRDYRREVIDAVGIDFVIIGWMAFEKWVKGEQ